MCKVSHRALVDALAVFPLSELKAQDKGKLILANYEAFAAIEEVTSPSKGRGTMLGCDVIRLEGQTRLYFGGRRVEWEPFFEDRDIDGPFVAVVDSTWKSLDEKEKAAQKIVRGE